MRAAVGAVEAGILIPKSYDGPFGKRSSEIFWNAALLEASQQGLDAFGLYMSAPDAVLSSAQLIDFMSQHRSLKGASTITAKRNVLKRFERVELLKKRGQFKPGDKVIGLRKTQPEA